MFNAKPTIINSQEIVQPKEVITFAKGTKNDYGITSTSFAVA
jgi:hypothetical protein